MVKPQNTISVEDEKNNEHKKDGIYLLCCECFFFGVFLWQALQVITNFTSIGSSFTTFPITAYTCAIWVDL